MPKVRHAYNPSNQEVKMEDCEFEASLLNIRPCLNRINNKNKPKLPRVSQSVFYCFMPLFLSQGKSF